jgi:DNA-binding response OmpR family regulator
VKTILVLEDEWPVLKLLRHRLRQCNVVEATSADEALLLSIDLNYRIDLLVADLTLPKRSGIQVALRLRTKIPDLSVIVTSRYPVSDWSGRDSADLQRLGSHSLAILQKPFETTVLLSVVCDLLGESRAETARTA